MRKRLQWLTERARFWWTLLWGSWWDLAPVTFTVITQLAFLRDEFLPPDLQKRFSMPEILQSLQLGWQGWMIGVLLITLVLVLERAYRKWAEEHQHVLELMGNVDVKIHSAPDIPLFFTAPQHDWLIVPRVTITNLSERSTASIEVELRVLVKGIDASIPLAPGSTPVAEYEQQDRYAVNHCLTFPLNLASRHADSGYIAFSADLFKRRSVDPDFTNCSITFTNLGKIIWSQAIRFA